MRHRIWRIVVILAPLALATGIWLIHQRGATAGLRFSASRAEVVQTLRTMAADRGWATEGWDELVDLSSQNNIRHYLETTAGAEERRSIAAIEPPVLWRVRLVSKDSPRKIIGGDFDPSGRLVAFHIPPTRGGRNEAPEAAALGAARRELAARVGDIGPWELTGTGSVRDADSRAETRRFSFRRVFSSDLSTDVAVDTAGTEVVGFVVTTRVSRDYISRHHELTTTAKVTRGVLTGLMIFIGLIYIIARFVVRFREQEIPLKRSVIVALIVALSFAVVTTVSMATQTITALGAGNATSDAGMYLGVALVMIVAGVLLGLTWGACEADLREAYPQKLISTDAALGGLLAARPVRASLAIALTVGCYVVLFTALEAAARASLGIWAPVVDAELMSLFAPRPALLVVFLSFSTITSAVALFMTAVSITHRKGVTRRAQVLTVVVITMYMLAAYVGTHSVAAWGVAPALIAAAALLVPFFAADLLAVIAVTIVTTWATFGATLLAQPAPALHSAGWTLLLMLGVLAAAGAVAAWRIRATNIEAARPEYAKNISERLSLAAELSTAREARQRVMPRVVPSIPGLEIAARHSDETEPGTDYFEFFPTASRVGIAVADARLEGLSSALCISMLKGLLLNYTERFSDPEETIARVEKHLASVFGNDIPLSLYYGVLDPATAELRSATLGNAPRAMLVREGNAEVAAAGIAAGAARSTVIICSAVPDRDDEPQQAILADLAASAQNDPATLATLVAARLRRAAAAGHRSWTVVAFRPQEGSLA